MTLVNLLKDLKQRKINDNSWPKNYKNLHKKNIYGTNNEEYVDIKRMDQINTNIEEKAPSVVNVSICFTETFQKNIVKKKIV